MSPIKKLRMEGAAIPDSQKDAAYYWDLTAKFNRIAAVYNRSTVRFLKWTVAFLVIALLAEAYSVIRTLGES